MPSLILCLMGVARITGARNGKACTHPHFSYSAISDTTNGSIAFCGHVKARKLLHISIIITATSDSVFSGSGTLIPWVLPLWPVFFEGFIFHEFRDFMLIRE